MLVLYYVLCGLLGALLSLAGLRLTDLLYWLIVVTVFCIAVVFDKGRK